MASYDVGAIRETAADRELFSDQVAEMLCDAFRENTFAVEHDYDMRSDIETISIRRPGGRQIAKVVISGNGADYGIRNLTTETRRARGTIHKIIRDTLIA